MLVPAVADQAKIVDVRVAPADINLSSKVDKQTFLVQAVLADNTTLDVTSDARLTFSDPTLAKVNGNSRFGASSERVPVRISLENPPPNLTPGMRADINVRIYDWIKLW